MLQEVLATSFCHRALGAADRAASVDGCKPAVYRLTEQLDKPGWPNRLAWPRTTNKEWNMLRKLMRAAVLSAVLCALGAVTASAGFAACEITVGSVPAAIKGEQATVNVFAVTNTRGEYVKIHCFVAAFEGELPRSAQPR
jgi:hypothetical protein